MSKRGFAAMVSDGRQEELRAIASAGGKAAHVAGTAHQWTSEEAKAAGRKGAAASHAAKRARKAAEAKGTSGE